MTLPAGRTIATTWGPWMLASGTGTLVLLVSRQVAEAVEALGLIEAACVNIGWVPKPSASIAPTTTTEVGQRRVTASILLELCQISAVYRVRLIRAAWSMSPW